MPPRIFEVRKKRHDPAIRRPLTASKRVGGRGPNGLDLQLGQTFYQSAFLDARTPDDLHR